MAGEPAGRPPAAPGQAQKAKFDPTDRYEVRQVEGWRLLVNKDFTRERADLCAETLKVAGQQLFNIVRHVPAPAVAKLRQIPIWVEFCEPHHPCMAYHPDAGWLREHDMNPDKAGAVEIANAQHFLRWTLDQPWMVLHELAHGYHHRFLPGGFENPELTAAYRHAKEAKLYDAVLCCGGQVRRAYALTDPQEYFAESSEAFFGTNDFFPFVRAELQRHDPQMFQLLERLWGRK
jgi:hypothetical protein